jgi:putative peptidoglycan lipid II flippase
LLLPPLLTRGDGPGGSVDAVRTLEGIGIASSLGMTVAGAALLVAVHRSSPGRPLVGLPRTIGVLVVGGGLGALAGTGVSAALLPAHARALEAVGVGALAALVAGLVAAAFSLLGDRGTVRALRSAGRRGGSAEPAGAAEPADPAEPGASATSAPQGAPKTRDGSGA